MRRRNQGTEAVKPFVAFSLQLKSQRDLFRSAVEDIEMALGEGTVIRIDSFRLNKAGETVRVATPENDVPHDSDILVMGYVEGPEGEYENLNPMETEWGKKLVEVLKDHNIKYESETVN